MKTPTIRPHRPEDRAALIDALIGLQEFERSLHDSRRAGAEIAEPYFDRLLQRLTESSGMIFVAELDGEVIGFVACRVNHDDFLIQTPDANTHGYISDLEVNPHYRGNGVAAFLLEAAERYLSNCGVARIRVDTLANNESALKAYQKFGFKHFEVALEKRVSAPT